MSGDEDTGPADVRYETKTVQAIRGTVARTVANWEEQGWEVESQSDGLVRSEITLRRVRQTIDARRWVVVGAGVAVLVAAIVAVSILAGGGGHDEDTAAQPAAGTTTTVGSTPSPTAAPPATSSPSPTKDADLTPDNNADLAAILALTNYCDPQIADFAETYRGRTIAFPASVAYIGNHNDYTTRLDILLAPGDAGGDSTAGPAFQFRDVNLISDLHVVGDGPNGITVGTLLDVTAEVDQYDATNGCLFLLQPVQTSFR